MIFSATSRDFIPPVRITGARDSHVKTRLCQYEALSNGKGVEISKQIVRAQE
jgi:hypothetical protein